MKNLTRAAIVYLGAVLAPGCGPADEEPEEPPEVVLQPYGAPPLEEVPIEDPPEEDPPEQAPPPEEVEPEPESTGRRPRGSMAQPYGASAAPPEDQLEELLGED